MPWPDTDQLFEPQDAPRAVSAMGMEMVTQGWEKEPHAHRKAQLVLAVRGLITCDVAKGRWLVPPQGALWIPSGVLHSMKAVGALELYCLFIAPDLAEALPRECCAMAISPLLRELVIEVSRLPVLYDPQGRAAPLIRTMLNTLEEAPIEHLHLPMPADPRLRRLADALAADPADRATIALWAQRIGMSERSLHRLIQKETGMSFLRWRQQFQIMLALEQLAQGVAVQTIALDLGYESASAFITMFRKILGQSPGKYLETRVIA
ncbi:AraC family transcriptional regulator [Novosphingobium terrae]|uniref:AraC family transcriptional regulator n=1 Tax=Novosphingobium terrae TaxID=2726189 RepID=UPI0019808F4F|nr:helix-turn-helix transcriptional regulator [Novosphingobium terrae]